VRWSGPQGAADESPLDGEFKEQLREVLGNATTDAAGSVVLRRLDYGNTMVGQYTGSNQGVWVGQKCNYSPWKSETHKIWWFMLQKANSFHILNGGLMSDVTMFHMLSMAYLGHIMSFLVLPSVNSQKFGRFHPELSQNPGGLQPPHQ
jgi:hypothetical protein